MAADEPNTPVAATAALIDPESLTVFWANHPTAPAALKQGADDAAGIPIEQVLPMAEAMGVPEALRAVAKTGVARHLSADVVSMSRRSVALVVSIYRLPDGKLLLLAGDAWRLRQGQAGGTGERRPGR